jgi:hypothetical protein
MVLLVFDNLQEVEVICESFNHNNALIEVEVFKSFHKKFERARIFTWLLYALLMSRVAVELVSNVFSLRKLGTEEKAVFNDSFVEVFMLCINIECKKGMNFEAVMPISNKYLINLTHIYKLSR